MKNIGKVIGVILFTTALVFSAMFIACDGDDNSGSSAKVTITGGAQKGPFKPLSEVLVYTLNAGGERIGEPKSLQTGKAGDFTTDLDVGVYEAQVKGRYWKEDEGQLSGSDIQMSAVFNITASGSQKVFVNPLSHMAAQRVKTLIKQGTPAADAIAQAEAGLREMGFSLPAPSGLPVSTDMDLLGGDTDGNREVFRLDCALMYAAQIKAASVLERDAKLQEIIDNASFDLDASGVFSDSFKALISEAEKLMKTALCTANLEKFVTENGLTGVTLPNIDKVVDTDGNGVANADEPNPWMVHIPAGPFQMGCNEAVDTNCKDDEKPYHEVILSDYYLDLYEVQVRDYKTCVANGGCVEPVDGGNYTASDRDFHPINAVTWEQADTYCKWAGKRLPTEAEWEKAARGTDGRIYPWGNTPVPSCENTIMNEAGNHGCHTDGTQSTQPVGSRPTGHSPYGILDMMGNIGEWVNDWYAADYYGTSLSQDPQGPAEGTDHVRRGGDFNHDQPASFRVSDRWHWQAPDQELTGFRCAKSAP